MKVPHVCHTTRFTSTSMQSEAYGTNMYRVLLFLYPSYVPNVSSFYKDGSSSMLRPPHPGPTRVPQFLTELRSARDTRAARRLRPSGSPAGAPPEDTYLLRRCDWGVASRVTGLTSGGVQKRAELKQKCSPGPSGRSVGVRASAPEARASLGGGEEKRWVGRGLDEGKVGADFVEGVVGGICVTFCGFRKRARKCRREGERHHFKSNLDAAMLDEFSLQQVLLKRRAMAPVVESTLCLRWPALTQEIDNMFRRLNIRNDPTSF